MGKLKIVKIEADGEWEWSGLLDPGVLRSILALADALSDFSMEPGEDQDGK